MSPTVCSLSRTKITLFWAFTDLDRYVIQSSDPTVWLIEFHIPVCHKSATVLDTPSQLGTLLGVSGGSGLLARAVQVWTTKGWVADDILLGCASQGILVRRTSTKYHHFRVVCVQIADVIGGHIYRVETVETSQQSQFRPTPMKSQSPSRRIPRLNHSLSFPRITTRKPQLPCQTTSELLLPNGAIHVDKIAAQTEYYLTVLEEHLDAIRDHPE